LGLKWKKKSQICNRPEAGYLAKETVDHV